MDILGVLMESDSDSQFSVVLDDGRGNSGTEVGDEGTEIVIDEDLTTFQFSKVFEDGGNSGFSGVFNEEEEAMGREAKEDLRAGAVLNEDLGDQTFDQNLRRDIASKTYPGRRNLEEGREESVETEDETREGGGGGGVHIGERTIQLNSLDNISRFMDEAEPSGVERRSGVDAIVVKCWGDVYLTGIGLFGSAQPEKPLSVHLRIFCNSNLLWEHSTQDWVVNQWGTIDVEPPLLLGSRWRYLIVARIAGAPCWQGIRGRPLYTLPRSWGRATQLGFYDPEEKVLAAALYDDEVEKTFVFPFFVDIS